MRLIALLMAVLLAQGAVAQIPVTAGTLSVPGDPIDEVWQRFKRGLAREAPDQFELKLFIRGELGGEEALMSAVRRGRVQLGSFTVSGMSAVVPEFAIIRLPYLFNSDEELDFVLDNFLAEPLWALAEQRNLQVLGWLDDGWMSLYARDPVLVPTDMVGYPMRAWQVSASRLFFSILGADTVFMGFPEVIPSLQTGLIKGSEMAPMTYSGIGLIQHAPHFILTRHSYNTGVVAANKAWLDELEPDVRAALLAAIPDTPTVRALFRDNLASYFTAMQAQGAIVHELDPEQRAAWVAASRPVHHALIEELGESAAMIYAVIQKGKRAYASGLPE